ncbi:MAG: hypothetical protein HY887_06340 [Deltaproteobacteria bacterium]|nr:hypothetical protein [Deltaproteobacteria bacterium]
MNDIREPEIDIMDYWRIVSKRKVLILLLIITGVSGTALYSLLIDEIYRSEGVITPTAAKETGAGNTTSLQQFSGIAGISIPNSTSASEVVNLLKSKTLREEVIINYNLLQFLFPERWDGARGVWKKNGAAGYGRSLSGIAAAFSGAETALGKINNNEDDGRPSIWDGLRALDDIVVITHIPKDNIVVINAEYRDPLVAADIVRHMMAALNEHMSNETKRVARANSRYLEEQLDKVSDPLIRNKIYNLIAQQIEISMMSEVKENFAFKVLDHPRVPDKRIRPRRGMMAALGLGVSLIGGVLLAFLMEYVERIRGVYR